LEGEGANEIMGSEETQDNSGKKVTLELNSAVMGTSVSLGNLTVWRSYSFAPEWYADAVNEARHGNDHHARRREIVFAVSSAESYIFEWVRDDILQRNFNELNNYFPPGKKSPVTTKWKQIPKQLKSEGLIPSIPDFSGQTWQNFADLVNYRNGLLHARASRPETDGLPEKSMPVPSKSLLIELDPGWATNVVRTLIIDLHKAVGSTRPDWLEAP
jgi:hypothetical protein